MSPDGCERAGPRPTRVTSSTPPWFVYPLSEFLLAKLDPRRGQVHRDLKPGSVLLASSAATDPVVSNTNTTSETTTTTKDVTTSKSYNEEDGTTTTTTRTTTTTTTTTVVTAVTARGGGASYCDSLKLTDFGRARSLDDGRVEWHGQLDEFMAPEMVLGKSHGEVRARPAERFGLGGSG